MSAAHLDPNTIPRDGVFDPDGRHWLSVRVFYEDTDFTGMIYHANYLRFFERGRSSHLLAAGISHADLMDRPDPVAFTLTRANVDFRAPGRVNDLIFIETLYRGLTGARIGFDQRAWRGDTLLAKAEITAVCIHADGRPRRPLPEIASRLAPFVVP